MRISVMAVVLLAVILMGVLRSLGVNETNLVLGSIWAMMAYDFIDKHILKKENKNGYENEVQPCNK